MSKELLLDDFIMNQFNYKQFKTMVETFISLITLMQSKIGDLSSIKITPSYEMRFSMYQKPNTSKIETFILNQYDTKEKIIECISLYTDAFNCLTKLEQEIFVKTFFEKSNSELYCDSYKRDLYPRELSKIRKSAVIKFCIKMHFNELNYEHIYNGGDVY